MHKDICPNTNLFAFESNKTYIEGFITEDTIIYHCNIENYKFPFGDNSIDVFIANQVLEHIKEILWIFHEVSRSLHIGGHFLIGVPNLASLHNRLLLLFGQQPTQLKNYSAHIRGFTKGDIERFISCVWRDGYVVKDFAGSQFYPFPRKLSLFLARLIPSMSHSIFFCLRENKEYLGEFIKYPILAGLETIFYVGENNGPGF